MGDEANLGYEDSGKEIWEDAEAAKEHRRIAFERQQVAKENAKAVGSKATAAASPTKPPQARGTLHQLFQSGARAASGDAETVPTPVGDAHMQRELDEMLQDMCGELEAGDAEIAPAAAMAGESAGRAKNRKRKSEGSGANGRASRKKAKKAAGQAHASVADPVA